MIKTFYSDKRGQKYLSAAAFVVTVITLPVLNVLRQYLSDKIPYYMPEKIVSAIMIILAAVYIAAVIFILPAWYKRIKYILKDNEIIAYSGFFSRSYREMKLSSIQHATRISMPFSKVTCFNFIRLNALGGRMILMFLNNRDCAEIMRKLREPYAEERPPIIPLPVEPQEHNYDRTFEKYSLSYSSDENRDYVFKDNADILTSAELDDILDDYSGYTQLSFNDNQTVQTSFDDMEQLTFGDISDSKEDNV